jgi:cytochrome c peroxidase
MDDSRRFITVTQNRRSCFFARHQGTAVLALAAVAGLLILPSGCKHASFDPRPSADISPSQLFMFAALQAPQATAGPAALKVDLGRRLYYDTHLSANNSMSCNSCHQLDQYGVDPGHSLSLGFDNKPGGRNAPTVYNAGLQFVQFWDGRAATLAAQASGPMMNPVEMGMSGPEAVLVYIRANKDYVKQFKQAYPDQKDPVTMDNVTDAIAGFEALLLTPSRWDEYLNGNQQTLTEDEKDGLRVYLRSGCASCHAGVGMGGNSYAKLGAFKAWPDQKTDTGRMGLTHQQRDLMYFKVPLLRNVAQTGPWFHNGKVETLDEAVRLMGEHEVGRNLSQAEVKSIVAFLNALTGPIPKQFIQPPPNPEPAESSQRATVFDRKIDLRGTTEVERGE